MPRPFSPGAVAAGLLPFLLLSCHPPISFEVIPLERARSLVADPSITLLDVVSDKADQPGPLPGGVRWRLSAGEIELPDAVSEGSGVLVVGSSSQVAHRSAAALARAVGLRPLYFPSALALAIPSR